MIRFAKADDIPALLEIFNENIRTSTAIYMYEEQTLEERLQWFEGKQQRGEPLYVYEENGEAIGYCTYGPFRAYPAYLYTVEHSVYVHSAHTGKGIGKQLLLKIIEHAKDAGMKTIIGGIDASNEASIKSHERLGFTHAGTIQAAGFKFDRWLDLAFYQLLLPGPEVIKK